MKPSTSPEKVTVSAGGCAGSVTPAEGAWRTPTSPMGSVSEGEGRVKLCSDAQARNNRKGIQSLQCVVDVWSASTGGALRESVVRDGS
jgi:hypothetical protein